MYLLPQGTGILDPQSGLRLIYFRVKLGANQANLKSPFLMARTFISSGFVYPKSGSGQSGYTSPRRGGKAFPLITRDYDPEAQTYSIDVSTTLPGPRAAWKSATRPDALLISTAVSLNSQELKKVVDWIRVKLRVISSNQRLEPTFTAKMFVDGGDERVLQFMRDVGLDVDGLEKEDVSVFADVNSDYLPRAFADDPKLRDLKRTTVSCIHVDEDGHQVSLPFKEESDGTRALVSLAGPWIDAADRGITVFVDELHNSLHPFALKYLLSNYFTSALGRSGGQLVFTTHDAYPMDDTVLHRDQIWFAERSRTGGYPAGPTLRLQG